MPNRLAKDLNPFDSSYRFITIHFNLTVKSLWMRKHFYTYFWKSALRKYTYAIRYFPRMQFFSIALYSLPKNWFVSGKWQPSIIAPYESIFLQINKFFMHCMKKVYSDVDEKFLLHWYSASKHENIFAVIIYGPKV